MIKEKTDEFWDVYNKDREKTGRLHRRGDKLQLGDYHLAVHVCIFNSRGQLLIQQRQPFKKDWTNMWDLTVGGSAIAGDLSYQAAEREVFEELGLNIDLSNTRPRFTMNFDGGFDDYYIIEMDVDISKLKLQKEEVARVKFADKEEVLKMQEEGTMIPYWFMEQLFEIRGDYDSHGKVHPVIYAQTATMKNLESGVSMFEIIQYNSKPEEQEKDSSKIQEQSDNFRRMLESAIENNTAVCALEHNVVVGLLIFSKNGGQSASLKYMAVHPEYSERGIEKLLFDQCPFKLNITD